MGEYEPDQFLGDGLQALLLRGMLSALPNYIACIDRERRLLYLNRTLNRELAELLGKPIESYVVPQQREALIACVENAFTSGQRQRMSLDALAGNGKVVHVKTEIGRRKRVDPNRVDLGVLASASMRMLRAAIPENVNIAFEPPTDSFFVEVDAPQFEQVLINLCVNARDAMPNGGTLRVWLEPHGKDAVVISVADDGVGIPRDNLPRVFEPFFTTKGTGSGLGLAVAAGIVAAHGGTISAESDGVRGTTLKVRLPRTEGPTAEGRPERERPLGGSATILVAEDEPRVRAQVVRILRRGGYTVLEAENGVRAVEVFRAHGGPIDLLVLDAIMPLCDGWQAFLQIERLEPGIKALFTTGYAANVLPPDFMARGGRFLSKPFRADELLAKVGELLVPPLYATGN